MDVVGCWPIGILGTEQEAGFAMQGGAQRGVAWSSKTRQVGAHIHPPLRCCRFECMCRMRAAENAEQTAAKVQVDRLAAWIQDRGLAAPAMALFETSKPLLPIGAQLLLLLQPLLGAFGPAIGWLGDDAGLRACAAWLEDPAAVDDLLTRLEERAVD
jgi:hypothetical protein